MPTGKTAAAELQQALTRARSIEPGLEQTINEDQDPARAGHQTDQFGPVALQSEEAEHSEHQDRCDVNTTDLIDPKKHLPEGQWTLELTSLSGPVNVVALGGKRFEVSLSYRLAYVTPKPEKATK